MNDARPIIRPLALALVLALAACGRQSAAPGEEPPLAGARIGGPFALTDQNGHRVTDRDFAGRYRLVYFGYTYCPDVCPTSLQTLAKGLRSFEAEAPARAARVQPIFITVDPARDTPAVLRQYVAAFHPRLIGLTGSEDQIAAVAKEFAVFYQKQPPETGGKAYLVNHMSQAMLFGPAGEPIALLPQDKDAAAVAAELDRWVK